MKPFGVLIAALVIAGCGEATGPAAEPRPRFVPTHVRCIGDSTVTRTATGWRQDICGRNDCESFNLPNQTREQFVIVCEVLGRD